MPVLCANDVGIHYQSTGSGSSIILIHGLASSLAFWHPCIVRELNLRFRVIAYDLRGHGRSAKSASGYTPADLARELLSLMDHTGIKDAHLVGHSFGGMIALHFAWLFPERVKSITLADTQIYALQPSPARGDQLYWKTWREHIEKLGVNVSATAPRVSYGLIEELARQQNMEDRAVASPSSIALAVQAAGSHSQTRWRVLLDTTTVLADFANTAGLTANEIARIDLPALAIYGEHSHCLPTYERLGELLKNCRKVLVPGVGHFHPLTRPDEFSHHLRSFVECHSAA